MESGTVWKLLYYTFRVLHLIVNNIMAIPAYSAWILVLTPLRKWNPLLYWKIEQYLFKALLSFVVMWANTGGYKVIESGDDVSSLYDKHVLVLVNHQSTADIPCVMSTLLPKSMVVGQVMWIMDYIFMYTNFGWSSLLHGDFFIKQGKNYRLDMLGKLREHLRDVYLTTDKRWIVLFPEGGFLYNRRQRSKKFAETHDLPILHNVALPRLGAVSTILDTLGIAQCSNGTKENGSVKKEQCMDWVIDLTLAYPNGEPLDMHGICIGWWPPSDMVMHYRAYPVSDIPKDMEGRTQWLYDRYVEKEKMLEQYYTNKIFPDETDEQPRRLPRVPRHEAPFDKVFYGFSYLFYALSAYLFWIILYRPLWVCLCYIFSIFV